MAYRLAIQIEEGHIAWAVANLRDSKPYSIVRAGVRVFSTGRKSKTGVSLAEDRRIARSARRRLDRMQSRRARLVKLLIEYGFFPDERDLRKNLERLNPYELRARGLDHPLSPNEFARAVFHINKRRGYKSNRRLQRRDDLGGARSDAIKRLRDSITNGEARTVGEYLYKKSLQQEPVRARQKVVRSVSNASEAHHHQWFVDRSMIADEFDNLWKVQARFNQELFKQETYESIRDTIFFQRRWKTSFNRYCRLLPELTVAHKALPSVQLLNIHQCVNSLAIVTAQGKRRLNPVERSILVGHLGSTRRISSSKASLLLGLENGSYLADDQ
jgi:CRISPR-associated endonuclease Csn1